MLLPFPTALGLPRRVGVGVRVGVIVRQKRLTGMCQTIASVRSTAMSPLRSTPLVVNISSIPKSYKASSGYFRLEEKKKHHETKLAVHFSARIHAGSPLLSLASAFLIKYFPCSSHFPLSSAARNALFFVRKCHSATHYDQNS